MFFRAIKEPARTVSFIGADMIITGNLVTTGRLQIDGTVHGDVRCASLVQGVTGAVHGNIFTEEGRLAGLVEGAVEAGALTLEASCRVTGDILYESLGIATGAQVEGRFRRRKGEADHLASAAREQARQASEIPSQGLEAQAAEPATVGGAQRQRTTDRTPRRASVGRGRAPELFAVPTEEPPAVDAAE